MVVRYLIRGVVQGVGFRWFVMREAHRLSMRGWVSNLADGSVEVMADGAPALIADLERSLTRGPTAAQVSSVEKADVPHDLMIPNSFEIR